MKIEMPDHFSMVAGQDHSIRCSNFRQWFEENIEPFDFYNPNVATVVYSPNGDLDEADFGIEPQSDDKFKALLINIEQIKPFEKDTIEKIMTEFIGYDFGSGNIGPEIAIFKDRFQSRIDAIQIQTHTSETK